MDEIDAELRKGDGELSAGPDPILDLVQPEVVEVAVGRGDADGR